MSLMELESFLSLECSVTLLALMSPRVHDHMSRECWFEGTGVVADRTVKNLRCISETFLFVRQEGIIKNVLETVMTISYFVCLFMFLDFLWGVIFKVAHVTLGDLVAPPFVLVLHNLVSDPSSGWGRDGVGLVWLVVENSTEMFSVGLGLSGGNGGTGCSPLLLFKEKITWSTISTVSSLFTCDGELISIGMTTWLTFPPDFIVVINFSGLSLLLLVKKQSSSPQELTASMAGPGPRMPWWWWPAMMTRISSAPQRT